MTIRRLRLPVLVLALLGTSSACGGGPGPNLDGPRGPSLMASYSGDWVLLRMESDDFDTALREAMAGGERAGAPQGGRAGGMTGGRGGGGGMTGGRGGARGGSRGGVAGSGVPRDPDEMRRIMQAARAIIVTPLELRLTLRPETATLVWGSDPDVVLTLGAEEKALLLGPVEYFATAEWTDEGLVIVKKVDGGGEVEDKISVDDEGRLVVERVAELPMRRKVKGTLVFREKVERD